jgi:hypothetical protein
MTGSPCGLINQTSFEEDEGEFYLPLAWMTHD